VRDRSGDVPRRGGVASGNDRPGARAGLSEQSATQFPARGRQGNGRDRAAGAVRLQTDGDGRGNDRAAMDELGVEDGEPRSKWFINEGGLVRTYGVCT
jgi:hypothetical protein